MTTINDRSRPRREDGSDKGQLGGATGITLTAAPDDSAVPARPNPPGFRCLPQIPNDGRILGVAERKRIGRAWHRLGVVA